MPTFSLFVGAVFRIVLDKIGLLGKVDPQQAIRNGIILKRKYKVSVNLNDGVNVDMNLNFCEPFK